MAFPLPLFPQDTLGSSVFTTVWIGVCVVAFFNLRFGWVLSGLVVPGYLVPLLLLKPWAAAVIFVEAVVTYALVWLYSEKLSRLGLWDPVFGRDRFFALLVVSVLVRIGLEVLLLPEVGRILHERFALSFDYRSDLHSFGLIVVALMANQFWKPGFLRGLLPMAVTVGLTLLIVRFGLMAYTNFSLGNLAYMYEDLASSILASPKAYIILLATAWIASRMNLHYGWEYSGILIPALLALMWYQPSKLAFTFVEAFFILAVSSLLLRLPVFRNTTMEGARKILLFFTVSFLYKLGLSFFMLEIIPEYKSSDAYAFGYLLASLLAVKMHDKQILGQVTRATLQTSFVAMVLAGCIGFVLTQMPNVLALRTGAEAVKAGRAVPPMVARGDLSDVVQRGKMSLLTTRRTMSYVAPLPGELSAFDEAMKQLETYVRTGQPDALLTASALLSGINYLLEWVEGRYLVLREHPPVQGWGTYVINLHASRPLLVEVPTPLEAWGVLEAGSRLFSALGGRALAVAGTDRESNPDRSSDMLQNRSTFFRLFQRTWGREGVLQVRGYTTRAVRTLTGVRPDQAGEVPEPPSNLWIQSRLPAGLELGTVGSFLGDYRIHWGRSPFPNVLRDAAGPGFAELMLNRSDRRTLFYKPALAARVEPVASGEQSIVGYLQDWMFREKDWLAEKGSNLYVPPTLEEMLYFDEEILQPLLHLARREYEQGGLTAAGQLELQAVRRSAGVLDYRVLEYRHTVTGLDYLILVERRDPRPRRYWGTYVFLLGEPRPYMVQIPRPLYETHIFEYGIHLFDRLKARVLLVGGAHPDTNIDGSADPVQMANRMNPFNLVSQVVLREMEAEPMLVLQCRGYGLREGLPPAGADVVLAFHRGLYTALSLGPRGRRLLDTLHRDGMSTRFVDGSAGLSGYEVGGMPQAVYLDQTVNKRFALLWLSPMARGAYRMQDENRVQNDQFAALDIPTRQADLSRLLRDREWVALERVPPDIRETVRIYVETRDVVQLRRLQKAVRPRRLTRVIDLNTKQAYVLMTDETGRPVLVANLAPRTDAVVRVWNREDGLNAIGRFVETGAAWLLWGGAS